MRIGTIVVLVIGHLWAAAPCFAQSQMVETPLAAAIRFLSELPSDLETALRAVRTAPLSARGREYIRTTLPPAGELTPTRDEAAKLKALEAVLIYHERQQVFDIKVIDLPQAVVGLHARSILLITRPALSVLEPPDLQALAAHEVGHDFLWSAFEQAYHSRDAHARQRLELQCDGIAVLTLVALGLDPTRLLVAIAKLERFNERFGVAVHAAHYPTFEDRERLVTTLLRQRGLRGGVSRAKLR